MHAPATASPGAMALLALAEHGEACGACDILTPSTAYPRSDYDGRVAGVVVGPRIRRAWRQDVAGAARLPVLGEREERHRTRGRRRRRVHGEVQPGRRLWAGHGPSVAPPGGPERAPHPLRRRAELLVAAVQDGAHVAGAAP